MDSQTFAGMYEFSNLCVPPPAPPLRPPPLWSPAADLFDAGPLPDNPVNRPLELRAPECPTPARDFTFLRDRRNGGVSPLFSGRARARAQNFRGDTFIGAIRSAGPGPASLHAQSLFTLEWKSRRARSGNQYREKP